MGFIKKNFTIAIIPFLVVTWGIFIFLFFDPFYSKSSDPEFPYLINGLNCALLHFNRIGHIDHPGTPFQLFNGIVIRITHLFSGKGDISKDVFSRPEYYLNAISLSMLFVQVILTLAIGTIGLKRKIPFLQIAILQSSCFFNEVLSWLLSRVNPDRFFIIVFLIFILIYLKHGYQNRSMVKFSFWSGVVMALGFATKFNFLPLLILPLLFIDTNKNRLIYVGSGFASFLIFVAPIIDKFKYYRHFITAIFQHDGAHGNGAERVFNLQKMINNTAEIFRINPGIYVLLSVLILLLLFSIRYRRNEAYKRYAFLFIGFITIIAIQIIMVSKHYANYYLVPLFAVYGFMFFVISQYISKLLKNAGQIILACCILPLLFLLLTVMKVKDEAEVISKMIGNREKSRLYVEKNISKEDFWFVEPTWESGPYVENALVYGMCYCGHRKDYLPQLMAVNPNVITYEGNKDLVKLWRCLAVSLDSVMATGKNINVYSTPGRNADVLIQMLQEAAVRNSVILQLDTIYNDTETREKIVRAKVQNQVQQGK
jgi:hypothetical protein